MVKPSANNSQVLVWRPANGQSVTVVPPKETYKESTPVTLFRGAPTMNRKSHMIRKLTQEVTTVQSSHIKTHFTNQDIDKIRD